MLRVRTGYSFRQAAGKLEDVIERLKEINTNYAPITDRASTFGWVRWGKLAEKAGMKPVFGVELAVSSNIGADKPDVDYWIFISRKTVEPINALITKATSQFRYQPLLSVDQAFHAASSKQCTVIMGHRPQVDWEKVPQSIYLSVGPSSVKPVINAARKAGIKLAATSDNRFVRPEDMSFYETLAGRSAELQTYDQHIQTQDEWLESTEHLINSEEQQEALRNSISILKISSAKLLKARLPHIESKKTLRQLCTSAAKMHGVNLKDPIYKERLNKELDLIAKKGYEDYFYIVADLCQWARKHMIVGPARGSSCGSLVCFLLDITTIDPIPHGLIFERFVDINRTDMPDIDIDFSDQKRDLVFEYLSQKYGYENTARLGTVAMYQPRSSLAEVGASLRIPAFKTDSVVTSLIERSSGDSRALHTLEDTLNTMPAGKRLIEDHPEAIIATKFEGHPRHCSQHAAGVVIASEPIRNFIAVDSRTKATMCDKKDAEDGFNLLKIDALGLTQLSVFEDALDLAGLPNDTLDKLPLDDESAFEVLNLHKFAGIFQFNGMALQSIVKQFKVTKFDDIVSVTALARPGPLASGGAHEWIKRKNKVSKVTFPHPLFKPYLEDTLGIVLYQEQVMEIGRNIGDLDWGQVTALRKAMSKSLGKEYFDQFGDPWKKSAIAKGVDAKEAEKVWDDLCAYGAWSFNKSHSVAYGLISYWCCWLKANYPYEYAAASLTHEKSVDLQIKMLREMSDEGISYIPVDAEYSTNKWTVATRDGKKILVGPLQNVKGIGPKSMQTIMNCRELNQQIPEKYQKLLNNSKTQIDSLWPIRDAFKRILPDPSERNIHTRPTKIADISIKNKDYSVLVFCTMSKINPRDENEVVNVAKRGYEIKGGKTASLNLQLTDDTDTIFGKVSRFKYDEIGTEIENRGRVGKALYAILGKVKGHGGDPNRTFRMIMVERVKYIGDIDDHDAKLQDKASEKDTSQVSS